VQQNPNVPHITAQYVLGAAPATQFSGDPISKLQLTRHLRGVRRLMLVILNLRTPALHVASFVQNIGAEVAPTVLVSVVQGGPVRLLRRTERVYRAMCNGGRLCGPRQTLACTTLTVVI
jgi:hypothetical protein